MEAARRRLHNLVEGLGIGSGDLVYLHTSFSRLAHLELSPDALVDTLVDHLGREGTLVMPSFAWHLDPAARPWKGYADYFATRPTFDVRTTRANIGVVPELFRHRPGVLRSAHYWWSVTAHGPLAETLTTGQERVVFPYGPDSAFGLMHCFDVKLLGLGVTLNTTSLALVADHALGAEHPHQVLSGDLEEGVVIDASGRTHLTRSHWLLPEVVRQIKPVRVAESDQAFSGQIARADHGDSIQFAYGFNDYFVAAVALGRDAARRDAAVPWLEHFPLKETVRDVRVVS